MSAIDYYFAMFRSWFIGVVALLCASLGAQAEDEIPHVGGAGADLRGQGFELLDLTGADFRAADLRGANLRGVSLVGSALQGADLRGAELQGADLRGANLQGADLRGARLARADLSGADLTLADLRDVDFFIEVAKPRPTEVTDDAEQRPRKSEQLSPEAAANRTFSVKGAVLDRALQSKPICVYPPTSAVDVLHDFDRAKGLPLVANGAGDAPPAFIDARTGLFATIGCSDVKGQATFGLARRALGPGEAPQVAGYDADALRRLLAAHDCAGASALPEATLETLKNFLSPP